ncbi:hypothetical protein [uncultured Leifsonia sp.]|uniref:hypothetical protein n=1 Tax=uncultured Leifsonia sp. TaxID=340359 RepID=UPI0028D53505|nr:hypothetical protein [uncultured Leifsonia sp.]
MSASELEMSSVRYPYRERIFHIEKRGPGDWVVLDESHAELGRLIRVAAEGEEHEPVFGAVPPGYTETLHEGSDWRFLVAALINEALDTEPAATGNQGEA